jgi:hypothetical protein
MRTIPQIRKRLHEIADELESLDPAVAAELHDLAEETKRRSPVHMARKKDKDPNPPQEIYIRQFAAANPTLSYKEIAHALNTGIRCVSYAIAGRRGEAA